MVLEVLEENRILYKQDSIDKDCTFLSNQKAPIKPPIDFETAKKPDSYHFNNEKSSLFSNFVIPSSYHGFFVYRFSDDNNVLYIGKSKNIRDRLICHMGYRGHLPKECIDTVSNIDYIEFDNSTDMDLYEIFLISYYQPKYNNLSNYPIGKIMLPLPDYWNRYTLNKKVERRCVRFEN